MKRKALEIRKHPDSILRKKCKPVMAIGLPEQRLFNDMVFAMHASGGIGLAAPQVGISRQFIVADVNKRLIKLANPEILKTKGAERLAEGCLSVPDMSIEIKRPHEIIVAGLDAKGKTVEIKARGLLARVLLHEIDHLKGKLIIDYAGPMPRDLGTLVKKL